MDVDEDRVAPWRGVLQAQHRVVRAIEQDLAAQGLVPLTWYDVLLELNAAGGHLRMQQLGERVVLSRSRVSRLVDELEREGLVERSPDPDDGRATRACVTETGKQALRDAAPVYLEGVDRYFTAHLTDPERRAVARGLQRVVDAHDQI